MDQDLEFKQLLLLETLNAVEEMFHYIYIAGLNSKDLEEFNLIYIHVLEAREKLSEFLGKERTIYEKTVN